MNSNYSSIMPKQQPFSTLQDVQSLLENQNSPDFGQTVQLYETLSLDGSQPLFIRLHPRIDKGFFKGVGNENHWICYRRNYFAVSCGFDLLDQQGNATNLPCLLKVNQDLFEVETFAVGIKASTLDGDKLIPIVQQTTKRDKGPQMIPTAQAISAGGDPHRLGHLHSKDKIAAFERLQFKLATANNFRRKTGQQFYVLTMELIAVLKDGLNIVVAMSDSCPLVVRGRSPNHYLDIDAVKKNSSINKIPMPMHEPNMLTPPSIQMQNSKKLIHSAPLFPIEPNLKVTDGNWYMTPKSSFDALSPLSYSIDSLSVLSMRELQHDAAELSIIDSLQENPKVQSEMDWNEFSSDLYQFNVTNPNFSSPQTENSFYPIL